MFSCMYGEFKHPLEGILGIIRSMLIVEHYDLRVDFDIV